MISISKKPRSYKGSVNWYVAEWRTQKATVFRTKTQAIAFAKNHADAKCQFSILNVDWIAASTKTHQLRNAIGKNYEVSDLRD